MDSEIIFKTLAIIIPVIGAIIVAYIQVRSRRLKPRSPSALKSAVEVYNMLNRRNFPAQRKIIKTYIDNTITHIYSLPAQGGISTTMGGLNWMFMCIGIIVVLYTNPANLLLVLGELIFFVTSLLYIATNGKLPNIWKDEDNK